MLKIPTKALHPVIRFLLACVVGGAFVLQIFLAYKSDMSSGVKYLPILVWLPGALLAWKWKFWKEVSVVFLFHAIIGGMLIEVPHKVILYEMIRNLYYHVPMWFAMIIVLAVSFAYSIRYLRHSRIQDDIVASQMASIGTVLGILGYATGALWANYTWDGVPLFEPRLISAATAVFLYMAYFVLRMSVKDENQQSRLSAIYNVFSFPTYLVLIYILPRLVEDSLHPALGENDGFSEYDTEASQGSAINDNMKLVFYPAIIGWTLLAFWLAELRVRVKRLYYKIYDLE